MGVHLRCQNLCCTTPASDPEEHETLVLQALHVQVAHLVVAHRAVGQLHVDVPGRVGHHHRKLAQRSQVEEAQVALDPLYGTDRIFAWKITHTQKNTPPPTNLWREQRDGRVVGAAHTRRRQVVAGEVVGRGARRAPLPAATPGNFAPTT